MPSGLDGNPNPIRSDQRDALLALITAELVGIEVSTAYVAVDGAPSSGKSTLADELARRIEDEGRAVIRSTTDSFHNPRSIRSRRGLATAESYYLDSHNLDVLRSDLLEPLRQGRRFRVGHFDEPTDSELAVAWQPPAEGCILMFDGLFLQRPELTHYWDYVIFLDADARRDRSFNEWASGQEPNRVAFAQDRYRNGWNLYIETCSPRERATSIIDNNTFELPVRLR